VARHRGQYDPEQTEPYELSRSRVENFVKCPACFHLQQVEGIKFPSIPGFNINEATDILLKRDFDRCRDAQQTHPFLEATGYGRMIPFKHEDFELWTQSLHFGAPGRLHTIHEPTHLKIGGGLDDVWLNSDTGQLHIVDYKSTSQKSPDKEINLNDEWKDAYKRQMDLYVWILRRKGFDVSDVGFFLYCDGDRFSDYEFLREEYASMKFKMTLIPYAIDQDWIEKTLSGIRACLDSEIRPQHSQKCEFGKLFDQLEGLKPFKE